jgi:hypothetical protein
VLENLVALCPAHHREHHRGGLAIEGSPEDLVFRDPSTGRVLGTGPPHPPPAGRPEPPPPPYRHPEGGRIDTACVWFAEAG